MNPAQNDAPNPEAVRRQLDRMLSSKVFAKRERLSSLFKYMVEGSLEEPTPENDAKLTEHQIGYALFQNYDSNKSDVRANASLLRDEIEAYYEECGEEDLVKIWVPAGGYRAVFSYNPRSPADKYYRRGLLKMRRFLPLGWRHESLHCFEKAIVADSKHALAHAAKGEAELREAMYHRSIQPHSPIQAADKSALEALGLQPRSWRAHVVQGAVHCCRYHWREAEESFQKALAIAPGHTRQHAWYAAYLLAIGKDEKALQLVASRASERHDDPFAQVAIGLFLYVARRFDDAEKLLCEVIEEFPDCWLGRIVQACVQLAGGNVNEAAYLIEDARTIIYEMSEYSEPTDNVFVGLERLCDFQRGNRMLAQESVDSALNSHYWALDREREGSYFEERTDDGQVKKHYLPKPEPGEYDQKIPFWTPFQVALACIGLQDTKTAIEALAYAVDQGDPMAVWLHRWPLLDPLRDHPQFQALIQRMNLP